MGGAPGAASARRRRARLAGRGRTVSVYDLTADRIGGPVDFAFSGAILLHLRDPVRALAASAARSPTGAELRLLEPFSPRLTLLGPRRPAAGFRAAVEGFDWWLPNLAALGAWLRAAGLREERRLAGRAPAGQGGAAPLAGRLRCAPLSSDRRPGGGVDHCYHRQGLGVRGRGAAKCGFPAPFEGLFSSATNRRFGDQMEVEIGRGKKGRRAYGFDDIAIVPVAAHPRPRRHRHHLDARPLPVRAAAAGLGDGRRRQPRDGRRLGKLGGLGVLNLEGIWTPLRGRRRAARGDRRGAEADGDPR